MNYNKHVFPLVASEVLCVGAQEQLNGQACITQLVIGVLGMVYTILQYRNLESQRESQSDNNYINICTGTDNYYTRFKTIQFILLVYYN